MRIEGLPPTFHWTTHAPLTFPWSGNTMTSEEASGRFHALLTALPSARMHLERVWLTRPHTVHFTGGNGEGALTTGDREVMATVALSYAVNNTTERGKVIVMQSFGAWQEPRSTSPMSPGRSKKARKTAGKAQDAFPADCLVPGRLEEWFDTYSMAETLAPGVDAAAAE